MAQVLRSAALEMVCRLLEGLVDCDSRPTGHYHYVHYEVSMIGEVVSLHETDHQFYAGPVLWKMAEDFGGLAPIAVAMEVGEPTLR